MTVTGGHWMLYRAWDRMAVAGREMGQCVKTLGAGFCVCMLHGPKDESI